MGGVGGVWYHRLWRDGKHITVAITIAIAIAIAAF